MLIACEQSLQWIALRLEVLPPIFNCHPGRAQRDPGPSAVEIALCGSGSRIFRSREIPG